MADTLLQETEQAAPATGTRPPQRSGRLWQLTAMLGGAVWVSGVVAAWYAVHRPFDLLPALLPALLHTGGDLLALAVLVAAAAWAGWRVIGLLGVAGLARDERAVFGLGLGLGLFALLILAAGLAGLPGFAYMPFVLVVLWVVGERVSPRAYAHTEALQRHRDTEKRGRGLLHKKEWEKEIAEGETERLQGEGRDGGVVARWAVRALWVVCGATAVLTLLVALLPPTGWDSLAYHLTGPTLYVQAGRVVYLRDVPFMNHPSNTEMLYTFALQWGSDTLAQAIHWLYGMLGAAALAVFGRQMGAAAGLRPAYARFAGLGAAALYLTTPTVALLMGWAYNDLTVTAYAALSLCAAWKWKAAENLPTTRRGYLVLAGLFGGLCLGSKYSAILPVAGVAAAVAVWGIWGGFRRVIVAQAWYWGAAVLCLAPWLVKNWLLAGNLFALLVGPVNGWSANELRGLSSDPYPFDLGQVLRLPVTAAIFGTTNGELDGTVSPLFLALLPVALVAAVLWRRGRMVLAGLWVSVAVVFAGWVAMFSYAGFLYEMRLVLPAFPALALAAALAAGWLWQAADERYNAARRLARFQLLCLVAAGAFFVAVQTGTLALQTIALNPLALFTGIESRDAFLTDALGNYYRAGQYIQTALPANRRVLLLYDARPYYLDAHATPDVNINAWHDLVERYGSPDAIRAALVAQGYTHIVISERGYHYYVVPPRLTAPLDVLRRSMRLVYQTPGDDPDRYSIYSLGSGGAP